MKKFSQGDVVMVEYKPIHPHIESMKEYDGCLGIVRWAGDKEVEVVTEQQEFPTLGVTNCMGWIWNINCLHLISEGDFKDK